MARKKKRPALPAVTVVCHKCGRHFELPGEDWDRNRKPWCSPCKQASIPGSKFQAPTPESKEIKRIQSKANRKWRKMVTDDDLEGVIRVIKDWKPVSTDN